MNLFYRYDYFLIWGHGIPYSSEIIDIISEQPEFEIVSIVKYVPENGIEEFVYKIYNFDYAPFDHLMNKTKYLLTTPCEVIIIFIRNHDPDETWEGTGHFRHLESKSIRKVKENIRNLYNEYYMGRRTENHVIHASDNEQQTDYLLKMIGYDRGVKTFEQKNLFGYPYHLPDVHNLTIKIIDLSNVYASIAMPNGCEIKKLSDTPHYKAAIGFLEEYEEYLEVYRGKRLNDFYSIRKFSEMIESVTYETYLDSNQYIVVRQHRGKYVICDGLHRASILLSKGVIRVIALEVIVNG